MVLHFSSSSLLMFHSVISWPSTQRSRSEGSSKHAETECWQRWWQSLTVGDLLAVSVVCTSCSAVCVKRKVIGPLANTNCNTNCDLNKQRLCSMMACLPLHHTAHLSLSLHFRFIWGCFPLFLPGDSLLLTGPPGWRLQGRQACWNLLQWWCLDCRIVLLK